MISYFKELIKSIAKCAITVLFVTMFSPITWIAYPVRHQDVQVLATGGGGGGGIVFKSFTASFSGWDVCGVLKGHGHGL